MAEDAAPPSSSIPPASDASYPVRSGNALRPLIDGAPAFRRIVEAVEDAKRSVWVTVTFLWATCQLPDGRGTPLDLLGRAAARGLDVRVIFWRPDRETESLKANAFWGSPAHVDLVRRTAPSIRIRWDRAQPGYCQHQKSWLIDAGTGTETTFLGGINLNPHSMVAPGHGGLQENHDVYVELTGPSAVDVHHNFVQRWNGASERGLVGGRLGEGSETDLPFPTDVPDRTGSAVVQVQRTIHRGRYTGGPATPEGVAFDIAAGERSILAQHLLAIGAARSSIYIENQAVVVPEIIAALHAALRRGVQVVVVMPAEGTIPEALADLAAFDSFTLAGIAGLGVGGRRNPVWIHTKLMLVDGEWGTVGSCNLHHHSLFGNSELNATFWDRATAGALLSELLAEHLGLDTSGLDDRAALRLSGRIARENRRRFDDGDSTWQGLAVSLLPSTPRWPVAIAAPP